MKTKKKLLVGGLAIAVVLAGAAIYTNQDDLQGRFSNLNLRSNQSDDSEFEVVNHDFNVLDSIGDLEPRSIEVFVSEDGVLNFQVEVVNNENPSGQETNSIDSFRTSVTSEFYIGDEYLGRLGISGESTELLSTESPIVINIQGNLNSVLDWQEAYLAGENVSIQAQANVDSSSSVFESNEGNNILQSELTLSSGIY